MTPRLAFVRRLLHWMVAVLVIAMIPAGLIFTEGANKGWIEALFGEGQSAVLYDLHKSTGVLVMALMAVRIGAKLVWPAPAYSPPLPILERVASTAAHGALYVLLIATPVLGWLGTGAFPAPVPVFGLFFMPAPLGPDQALSETLLHWHSLSAFALGAVAVVHVAAALYHRNVRNDTVFDRIALFPGHRSAKQR